MKKLRFIIVGAYVLVLIAVFYFYFGVGLVSSYKDFNWRGVETRIPADFKTKTFSSHGWQVYYLEKMAMRIKIAVKPAIDVSRLSSSRSKIKFRHAPSPDSIYFIAMVRKEFEMVFAQNVADQTLYFQIFSPSPFSSRKVLQHLTGECRFLGRNIVLPDVKIPMGVYFTDFLFFGGMIVPLIIILIMFNFSGRKPANRYFTGDPIQLEEANVSILRRRKFSRQGSYCYLVLTSTRLLGFMFMRPIFEIRLDSEKSLIQFEEKKIIIQREKEKITLKPNDIDVWKPYLMR
jgi:hypothetical protein